MHRHRAVRLDAGRRPAADHRAVVEPYAAASVILWLENIMPWISGYTGGSEWPTDAMREGILQGPPRV
ncbi:MAG: hypothetical protein M3Q65_16540 [Chloroflexota bacterium]|nr:hypothetical protein [Chloroflexota bacterium]